MDSGIIVSIVTATLNERGNVLEYIDRVRKAQGKIPYEIVVVDDNSTDGTIELLERIEYDEPALRKIVNDRREGLLKSNLKGLKASRGRIKVVMDADLQHPPEVLGNIVKNMERGTDCTVMSRFVNGGTLSKRDAYRTSATSLAIGLCHVFVPQTRSLKDPISGFFAIGDRVNVPYERLFTCFGDRRGYKVLVPIIANNTDKKFAEMPYYFNNRIWGESKIGKENLLIPRYLTELSRYHSLFKESVS
ncbi:MAG: glycosyltransferase [Candidatus Thermoplasmatota archaeon]|nr:glycosyltransferase [Candidatus Thermoplasmatota archaeon]